MKKLSLVVGLLLIPSLLFSASENVSERIRTRIASEVGTDSQIRQKIQEGSETDTTINRKLTLVTDEEIKKDMEDFAKVITPSREEGKQKNPPPEKYKYTQYSWKTVTTVTGGSASFKDGEVVVDLKTDSKRELFFDVK